MSKLRPDLDRLFVTLNQGFSNYYNILLDAYVKELALDLSPDIEGLKELTREYVRIMNLIASNSEAKYTLPGGKHVPGINRLNLTDREVENLINKLKSIFDFLVEKAQSYAL
jgi:hypothetical protein